MNTKTEIDAAADLLAALVRIDSSNPGLVPGSSGEGEIADFTSAWLEARGLECHRIEPEPGRPSVVAIHRGSGGGKSVMLNGHLDTVTLAGYEGDPLDPRIVDGRMRGRGVFDMKSGVAAIMLAAADIATSDHRGDLLVTLVADEEYLSRGTDDVLVEYTADAAIVVEPTCQTLVTAHRGYVWFEVTIKGRAAHGALRELGIDAIVKSGAFLSELGALDIDLANRAPHPLLETGSVHASLIRGGEELSSYPAECVISLERRTLPGEDAETVRLELEAILNRLSSADDTFRYEIREVFSRSPFDITADEPVVRAVQNAAESILGEKPEAVGAPHWTDCALLSDAGIPSLLYGPIGGEAHGGGEWADISSVATVRKVLVNAVLEITR